MKVTLIFLVGVFIPQWVSTEYVPRLDLEFEIRAVYQHQVLEDYFFTKKADSYRRI